MIICHCNVLTKDAILEAIGELIDEDRYRLITPGTVYRRLGKRGKCCGCFPQVVGLIVSSLEEFQTSNPTARVDRSLVGAASASLHSAAAIRPALQRD